jgi:hypothetical protein
MQSPEDSLSLTPVPLFSPPVKDGDLSLLIVREGSPSQVLACLEDGRLSPNVRLDKRKSILSEWLSVYSGPYLADWWSLADSWATAKKWEALDEHNQHCWVSLRMLELGASIIGPTESSRGSHPSILHAAINEAAWPVVEALSRHPQGQELPWNTVDLRGLVEKDQFLAASWLAKMGANLSAYGKDGGSHLDACQKPRRT